jgi:capsule polysaccharide export protein KpsE/RkpR
VENTDPHNAPAATPPKPESHVSASTQAAALAAMSKPQVTKVRRRALEFARRYTLFTVCVVIPTLLASLYFGLFASDIYVSESSYVVRSPNKKTTSSGIGAMLGSVGFSGFSKAQDDVHTVSQYILSRDALNQLDQKLKLAKSWGSFHIDFFRRFAPLFADDSKEALYLYYASG